MTATSTSIADQLAAHAALPVCHLETVGRLTGRRRVVELWFALDGRTLYFLAGGREQANWVKNIRRQPPVRVRIGGRSFPGTARVVEAGDPEDAHSRRLVAGKYQGWPDRPLSRWAATSLPVAVDIAE